MVSAQRDRDEFLGDRWATDDDGRKRITGIYAEHLEDIETVMGVLSPRRAGAPLAGTQEDRPSRRALPTRSFQGSARRAGAMAAATGHRVHERSIWRARSAQRSQAGEPDCRRPDSAEHSSCRWASTPHRWQTKLRILEAGRRCCAEGKRAQAVIALATGFAEQRLFACLQGSRRRPTRRLAARLSPIDGRYALTGCASWRCASPPTAV